jgi:hypothetical protein
MVLPHATGLQPIERGGNVIPEQERCSRRMSEFGPATCTATTQTISNRLVSRRMVVEVQDALYKQDTGGFIYVKACVGELCRVTLLRRVLPFDASCKLIWG